MKKKLFFIFLISSSVSFSQIEVNSLEYNERKMNNTLNGLEVISSSESSTTLQFYNPPKEDVSVQKSGGCNCYIEPDATYILAMTPNDDGSSAIIDIPFDFCFYGQNYNQLYINNNGNITFDNSLFAFSSNAFPSVGDKIIAPFWADVDTRGVGEVVYKITPNALYVNWVGVGYYNSEVDLVNTFQLIISDGTNPDIVDGNIAFCYKDMQWTTGAASQGVNGFEGIPATAGANKGDNVGFFQVAQFDHAGNDFDGALGNVDGISWLDDRSFYFDICNANNIPPIPDGISSCDTFTLCALSDTADIQIKFLSPEFDQLTTLSFTTTNGLVVNQIENIPGNTASIILQAIALPGNEGYHTVTVTATDDFVPAGVTTVTFTVFIDPLNGNDLNPLITPLEACSTADLTVLNGPYDTYLWNDLSVMDTLTVDTAQVYSVTVSRDGCYKKVSSFIQIAEPIIFDFDGSFQLCDALLSKTEISLSDSAKYSTITWGLLPDLNRDTMFVNELAAGTYTVSVLDSAGLCSKDTTFTITFANSLSLINDQSLCSITSFNFLANPNTGGTGDGSWSFINSSSVPTFNDVTNLNTVVNFPSNGTYNLIYTDSNCPFDDTITFNIFSEPIFGLSSDFFVCPGQSESLFIADSLIYGEITWGLANQALDTLFSADLVAGTYNATLTDASGLCTSDTTFIIATQANLFLQNDGVICTNSLIFLNNIASSGNGAWTVVTTHPQPSFSSNSAINPTVTFSQNGLYSLIYTDAVCANIDDTVNITVGSIPNFNLISEFYDCPNATETTSLADMSNIDINSIVWDPSKPQFNDQNNVALTAGIYNASITSPDGCQNDTIFTINGQIDVLLLDEPNLCGLQLIMSGNNPLTPSGTWSLTNGPGAATFVSSSSVNTTVNVSEFGTYNFQYSESVCGDNDTFSVTFLDVPTVSVSDAQICAGQPYQIDAISSETGSDLTWSTNETGNSITVNESGLYTVTATNICGSADSTAFIDIRVCELNMPNVFTPNEGGLENQLFKVIVPSNAFETFSCQIFNRWGNLVYEYTDVFGGWNGKASNGDDCSPGTYFYKVTAVSYTNENFNLEGFIQLVR